MYPLLRPYGLNKLEYRSKPCIFLGYNHAGYKCLDLDSNKVYLSCHVVFDENSFLAMEKAVVNMPSKVTAQSDAPFVITVTLSSPSSSLVSHDITMSPLAPPYLSSPTNPSPTSSECPTLSTSLPNIYHLIPILLIWPYLHLPCQVLFLLTILLQIHPTIWPLDPKLTLINLRPSQIINYSPLPNILSIFFIQFFVRMNLVAIARLPLTFSPVIKPSIIHIILTLVVNYNWPW